MDIISNDDISDKNVMRKQLKINEKTFTQLEKTRIVQEMMRNNFSASEVGQKYGISRQTIMKWKKRLIIDKPSSDQITEMDINEINAEYIRQVAIVKLLAIYRVSELISKENNLDSLSKLLKELKDMNNHLEPAKNNNVNSRSIQVNQAIKEINNHKLTVNTSNNEEQLKFN